MQRESIYIATCEGTKMIANTATPSVFKVFIAILATVCSPLASSQTLDSLEAARGLADTIMSFVGKGNLSQAFETARPVWTVPDSEIDTALSKTLDQRLLIGRRFGDGVSVEFICLTTAGDSLAKFVYLEKFQNHATRWVMIFYRPKSQWRMNTIYWDDNIAAVFGCDQ